MHVKKMPQWLLSFLTRWLWRGVVVVILTVAVVVTAGREMAPLLREHKGWLEANLSSAIGQPVTMQSVSAYWQGLVPQLAAQELVVGDAVHVDRLLFRIDILASIKARALVFETLEVQHAHVNVPVGATAMERDFNLRATLEFLFSSSDIRIRDLDVSLVPANTQATHKPLTLHIPEVTIQNAADLHQLKARIAIGDDHNTIGNDATPKNTPLQLAMKFNGSASDMFSGAGSAHLTMKEKSNLPELGEFLTAVFSPATALFVTPSSDVNGQVWAEWRQQRIEWVSDLSLKALEFTRAATGDAQVTHYRLDYSGRLAGHLLTEAMQGQHYFLQVPAGQELSVNEHSYRLPELAWQYDQEKTDDRVMSFYLPSLKASELAQVLDLLPSEALRDAMNKLKPDGELANIRVSWPLALPLEQHLQIRANLKQVSVGAWQGAPALTQVNGYIEATPEDGMVELDSTQGFSMHYPLLYASPMTYEQATGRVYWTINPADKHVYVAGRQLDLHGEEGEVRGEFWLDLPSHATGESAELYLAVGLVNAEAKYRNKYLPDTLNPSLRKWLDDSIAQGTLSASGFLFRGALRKDTPLDESLLFFGNVQNARLQFDPAWPILDNLNGALLVDNEAVYASVNAARLLDFDLHQGSVTLKSGQGTAGLFLTIDTDANGSDILKVVHSTPLQKTLGDVFDGWQLKGESRAHLNLGINLRSSEQQDFQEIDWHLADNDLLIGGVNLPLQQVSGDVHYSSMKGLSSSPLSAHLWGKEQTITLKPETQDKGLPGVDVQVKGTMDPSSLALWTHLPLLHFLGGDIPFAGTISLPLDSSKEAAQPVARVTIHSDLQGVAIDLPAPLKKAADEKQSLDLRLDAWKDKQQYHLDCGSQDRGNLLSASVQQDSQGSVRGEVVLNQPDRPATELPNQFHVRATLDQAALSEWASVVQRYAQFSKADREQYSKDTQAVQSLSAEANVPSFDVQVHQFTVGSLKMDETKLSVLYHEDKVLGNYWESIFQSAMMGGRYRYFDDIQRIPDVELDTVLIGEADKNSTESQPAVPEDDNARVDPLADVVPQDLPALRVHAKQVILNGEDIGDWRFTMQPDAKGVTLNDLLVVMPGLNITGVGKNQGGTLHWIRDADGMHTESTTHLSLSNPDGIRKQFGMERIVVADKMDIEGSTNWTGSPAMISFRRLQGDVSITSEKGRFLNSTSSTDLMRVINVFNFSAWARRLKMDFTDLYKKGVSYDEVNGRFHLDRGKVVLAEPAMIKGPSGRFELAGTLDSVQDTIDGSLIVTIPVNQNMAWIAAIAVSLPVAASVWAVSKIFGDQIDKLSSLQYSVTGSLDEPKVKFVRLLPQLSSNDKTEAVKEKPANQADDKGAGKSETPKSGGP